MCKNYRTLDCLFAISQDHFTVGYYAPIIYRMFLRNNKGNELSISTPANNQITRFVSLR